MPLFFPLAEKFDATVGKWDSEVNVWDTVPVATYAASLILRELVSGVVAVQEKIKR